MIYWQPYAWDIEQEGDKYIVGKWSTATMRLGADGSFGFGTVRTPIEWYEFKTLEWASVMLHYCKRLEQSSLHVDFSKSLTIAPYKWDEPSLNWRVGNHTVVSINQEGTVLKLDLPWLVWQWLKVAKVSKFIKALMWGERGRI